MKTLIRMLAALLFGVAALAPLPTLAQAPGTQFIGITSYRVGPYGANGAAFFNGFIDYLQLVNARDGGINELMLPAEIIHRPDLPLLGTGKTDYPSVQKIVTGYLAAA